MKKLSIKMAVVALFVFVGTIGVNAQIGRGGDCLGTRIVTEQPAVVNVGACLLDLTEEQQAILDEINFEYQEEMAVLREAIWSAVSFSDKLLIRQDLVALRDAHFAEIQALLEEWGY